MVKCIADEKGILFVRDDGSMKGYKVDELAPGGASDEELLEILKQEVFPRNPGFEEAYKDFTYAQVFCSVDGHWEWDMQDGRVVCAECGEPPYNEFEGLLIPSPVIDAMKEMLHARREEPAKPAESPGPDRGKRRLAKAQADAE